MRRLELAAANYDVPIFDTIADLARYSGQYALTIPPEHRPPLTTKLRAGLRLFDLIDRVFRIY